MVTSLIKHERIKTTVPKAKELRKLAERCVTYAKHSASLPLLVAGLATRTSRAPPLSADNNATRRRINNIVREADVAEKLLGVIGPRYMFVPLP